MAGAPDGMSGLILILPVFLRSELTPFSTLIRLTCLPSPIPSQMRKLQLYLRYLKIQLTLFFKQAH